jgi:UDP-N-acetylglucosamine 2-epimerase (non-hydrolysing)
MPEEINRLLTDQVADLLFTPSEDGNRNLAQEGIASTKVHLVGNVMIDTLIRMIATAKQRMPPNLPKRFVLVTLHRPGNVDDRPWLTSAIETLSDIGRQIPVLFPLHPRTRRLLNGAVRGAQHETVRLMEPLPYLDFLALQIQATAVITDSGGIQEETTFLGIPCLTVRENTERPITVELGTNVLVGRDMNRLRAELTRVLSGDVKHRSVPPLWDGQASERIAAIIQ